MGIEQVISKIRGADTRPIYAVPVNFKPGSKIAKRADRRGRKFSVRLRGDVKREIASFTYNVKQEKNKLVPAFECVRIVE